MAPLAAAAFELQPDEEDLSDEQVHQLLQEAEDRLRARSAATESSSTLLRSLPKLSHGMKTSSYIKEKDGIAQVDAARLVDAEQRKLADTPRAAKPLSGTKKTVSMINSSFVPLCVRKIYPTLSLDADSWFVLDHPAFMRAQHIHSYSDSLIYFILVQLRFRGLSLTRL